MIRREEGQRKGRKHMPKDLPRARLIERQDITSDLVVMRFEPEIPYVFRPGQYCTIGIEGVTVRPYSIASTPEDPYLELLIRLVPNGALTPHLWELRVGDRVNLFPKAKGIFTFEEAFKNQVMIATVTGLAPFMSMVRDYMYKARFGHHSYNGRNIYIFHGASYMEEFAGYHDELDDMFPYVVYVPTISRPNDPKNANWNGRTGRVNAVCEDLLKLFGITPASTLVYLCGNPGMIDDLEPRLAQFGYQTKLEKYWK